MTQYTEPREECQFYDYAQAAEVMKTLGNTAKPVLGIVAFPNQGEEDLTLVWGCPETVLGESLYYMLPILKGQGLNDISPGGRFTSLDEGDIVLIKGVSYLIIDTGNGLGVRKLQMLFNETIASTFAGIHGYEDMEMRLYRVANKDVPFSYIWIGEGKDPEDGEFGQLALGLFVDEDDDVAECDISDLKLQELHHGDCIIRESSGWLVREDDTVGIDLMPYMTFSYGGAHKPN